MFSFFNGLEANAPFGGGIKWKMAKAGNSGIKGPRNHNPRRSFWDARYRSYMYSIYESIVFFVCINDYRPVDVWRIIIAS